MGHRNTSSGQATSIRRIALYGSVLLFLAATVLIWWVVAAGPTTVYRTVRYNFSGIDDDRIFPRRMLTPAPRAFRFREAVNPEIAALSVRVNGSKDIPLTELLHASQTTAFLVIKDDAIVFEEYSHGYDRATPSLSFSISPWRNRFCLFWLAVLWTTVTCSRSISR